MKFFLSISFFYSFHIVIAQCPYKIDLEVPKWDGETITLKWHCNPKPFNGQFDIFRTCLTLKNDKVKRINDTVITKRYEYSDADTELNGNRIYQYNVQLRDMPKCSAIVRTRGRVIEEDTLPNKPPKDFSLFQQKDIVNIKIERNTTTANAHFPIEIEIKDLQFPFTSALSYALICGNKVFKTVGEPINDDFRFANIYILENAELSKGFRIALIQGNTILGVSPLLKIE